MSKLFNIFLKLKYHALLKNNVFIEKFSHVKGTNFEGNNAVGRRAVVLNCQIGKGSYLGNNVNFTDSKVGRFCSRGDGVQIIAAQHPIRKFVSTSPRFYSIKGKFKSYVKEDKFPDFKYVPNTNYKAIIGNDVWIGSNVTILGGLTIGDGVVIATGAVITKNVEPYSIVGGVPAKHLSNRFDETTIAFLLSIKWWDRTEQWLTENGDYFSDINVFMEKENHAQVI